MSFALHDDASSGRLVATFDGYLEAGEGLRSARVFAKALAPAPRDIVFDIRRMNGYHNDARRHWQSALWPVRKRIRSLTVVGGNAIVRMGAAALGLALGIRARWVPTLEGFEPPVDETRSAS